MHVLMCVCVKGVRVGVRVKVLRLVSESVLCISISNVRMHEIVSVHMNVRTLIKLVGAAD